MEILNKITELKAELDSLRPLSKDREAAVMQKLRLDWNYHSNHLEGNSLTFGETKALILFGITAAGKPLKDHFEMTGHDEAIKWVEEVVKEERPLTETFIRELHKLILKEPYELDAITPDGIMGKRKIHVGVYKSVPNHVLTPTGEIFRFATPEETPAKMNDLIDWYREKEKKTENHPLLLAAEFHYKYIRIHPFDDGNGRTARILMNFILMKYGYPPVIIKTEDKSNYIAALQQSDAGMITPFITYIGFNLANSLELMIKGAKGENIDEADDVDKEIALIRQKLLNIKPQTLIVKTKERIISIYDVITENLIKSFISESRKFDDFYLRNKFYVQFFDNSKLNTINQNGIVVLDNTTKVISLKNPRSMEEVLAHTRNHIYHESINSYSGLSFVYFFDSFSQGGISEFKHVSYLALNFEDTDYKVISENGNIELTKNYDEVLTESEIMKIIRAETKAHTDFINQQIELSKKQ